MWSRKPTPVSRVPAPVPSRASVEAAPRSRRSCARSSAVRLMAARILPLRAPPSTRRAPRSPRRGRSAPRRRRACAARRADPHLGHPCGGSAAATAPRRSARRRRSAARGWSRRRSRRRRSRSRRPTNRQPARLTSGASASTSAPISCRCSGANAFASSIASRGVGDLRRRANAASPTRRALDAPAARASRRARRRRPRDGETADDEAARAVLGLGEHVERRQVAARARRRSRAEHDEQVARARRSRRCRRCAESWCLASCTYRLPGPDDHVDAARRSRCRRRARRSPGRRPSGRRARTPHSRQVPRIAGSICPSAPGGAHTTTSSTPAARAVTTPITTVLG